MLSLRRLLWVDCLAGLLVGLTVLLFRSQLAEWFAISRVVLLVFAVANLTYATYSLSLAVQASPPAKSVRVLVVANAAWAVVCAACAIALFASATIYGIGYLVAEGVFVGGLACLEWRRSSGIRMAS